MKTILLFVTLFAFSNLTAQNIALNKLAEQSTTYTNNPQATKFKASNAVDGNTSGAINGNSVTHTAKQTNPWWRVDLGKIYNLKQINVYNRTDCCSDRLDGAIVYVGIKESSDPSDYIEVERLTAALTQQVTNLSIEGQFVMIYLPGDNKYLSLAEIEVIEAENSITQESSLWTKNGNNISFSSGKVGINTTIPDMTLTVNGNIHAKEVLIDLSVPAPDYVFENDYDLNSLKEVENFINTYGHLPNIPSAKTLESNGVEISIMTMKLLEKIEELTLYTLEQEKEIENQISLNKELENKNKDLDNRLKKLEAVILK